MAAGYNDCSFLRLREFMFYLIAATMLALALAFVLVPIFRNRPTGDVDVLSDVSNEAANLAAFRLQRREVEGEFERGLISEAERDDALDELARRLAGEVDLGSKVVVGESVPAKSASKPAWMLGFLVSLFIVVGSSLGYVQWGDHNAHNAAGQMAAGVATAGADAANNPDAPMSDQQVLALVDNLAKKMAEKPDDPRGWILLARSQNALGQYAAAATAFGRAAALTPNDAQLLADYADAQVMVQEGNFAGKPRELIDRALKIDPANMKALALAGTADMRAGNKPAAIKRWEKLQSLVPKDSDDFAQIAAIITEIKTGKPAFPKAAEPVAAPAAAATPPAVGKAVSGQINIAPALTARIARGDTLFVFARAASGPKMPLAVLRVPAPTSWPFVFKLDDGMAMAPGMSLSSFDEVVIEARISKAGDAKLQPGDLQGASGSIKPPAANITVNISTVAP